jgi:hypothetical protein
MNQQNAGSQRTASSTAGVIAAKSQETAEQLKDAVVDQVNQVRDKAQSAKDQTTDRIRGVAGQLRGVGDSLRDDDPFVAGLADRASNGAESLARYVSSATPQSVVRDTESLARRQPALFFGGAFLLGLAAGRFLKSSAPELTPAGARGNENQDNERALGRPERPYGYLPGNQSPGNERNPRNEARFNQNYDSTFGKDLPGQGSPLTPGVQSGVKSELSPPPVPRTNGDRGVDGVKRVGPPSNRGILP